MITPSTEAAILSRSLPAQNNSAASKMNATQIDQVSKDFESMFISMMLEQMFGESIGTEAFGDKETADVYKTLMTDAYAKEIAQAGGIGVASYVKAELLKLQEQEN